jgi:hypothetical protein
MNLRSRLVVFGLAGTLLAAAVAPVSAAGLFGSSSGFTPQVPISAFAGPASWFDPSRLHVSSMVSVGSGGFGGGANALQVTSLSYQFKAPLSMSVSLGNAWGGTQGLKGSPSFFLEGLNLQYRPNPSMQFQVQFRDIRSPLQLGSTQPGYWGW